MNYFCKAPFRSIAVSDSMISSCCMFPREGFEDFYTLEQLKESMENNTPFESCSTCTIKNHFDYIDLDNDNIQDMHIRLGNKCNAICRICRFRLKIGEEENAKDNFSFALNILNKNKHSLTKFSILGGETFLFKEELLSISNTLKDVELDWEIITNGTIADEEIISSLSKTNVTICISIDGNDKTNHKMRLNCHMDKILKTLELIKKYNIKFRLIHTISIFNIMELKENLIYYLEDLNIDKFKIKLNFVSFPVHYSISILPDNIKEIIFKNLIEIKNELKINTSEVFKFLSIPSNTSDLDSFKFYVEKFDKMNNTDYKEFLNENIVKSIS